VITTLFRALSLVGMVTACGYPAPEPAGGSGGYSLAQARADCVRCHQNAPFLATKEGFCAAPVQALIQNGAMPKGAPYDQSTKAASAKFCSAK
jgi:hypothetical protein